MDNFKKAFKKAKKRHKLKKLISISEYVLFKVYKEIKSILEDFELGDFQTPPEHIKADLTVIGNLEKIKEAAREINAGSFEYLKKAEIQGPFLNISLKSEVVFQSILKNLTNFSERYGTSDLNEDKFALIEYSAPNVARPIGVGHLRSTIIGEVLSRIYEATGYTVLRDNYLGDWGTQFGKLIYAYQTWGDKKKVKENPLKELKKLYVKFQEESEDNEQLVEKARSILKELEEGDKKTLKLWKRFRELSIREYKRIYNWLGVEFDHYGGESMFLKSARVVPEDCLKKGICKKGEQGVVIAEVDNLPTFLVRKQDNSTIYHSRDLAQLKFRVEKFKPDDILYVVGSEQTLYFHQLFALAGKLEYLNGVTPKHIGFGLVLGEDGKRMSTRHGTAVELENLIDQSIKKSRKIIEEKNPELSVKEKQEIAEKVGIGAIIYNDISQSREKNITFNWDRILDFETGSAVYLQYTYVRINSILEKYKKGIGNPQKPEKFVFEELIEFELSRKLMFFPGVVLKARENDSPHIIAVYLEELAGIFNAFYNKISIIKTQDDGLRNSRIFLAKGVSQVIKNGLMLLDVPVPKKM
jgi:arginyl-tRNA synthetase